MVASNMSSPPASRSRWLRFSFRALLLAVTVVCISLAWIGATFHAAWRQEAAAKAVERAGGGVEFGYLLTNNTPSPRQAALVPEWLKQRIGRHVFESVQGVYFGDPNAPDRPPIGDEALKLLAPFPKLREVCLWRTDVSDRGLVKLESHQDLHYLILWRNKNLTDQGLESVARLPRLRGLELYGRQFTDEGLSRLSKSPSLTELQLVGTRATPDGVKKLQQALPQCRIIIN